MTDRPLLFSGMMVRSILAGQKSQTRRAVKGKQLDLLENHGVSPEHVAFLYRNGSPGDAFWVRENARAVELEDGTDGVRYEADGAFRKIENTPQASIDWLKMHTYAGHSGSRSGPIVPSIHMPRWASRLTLAFTGVRVERLQDISEADAIAEGIFGTYVIVGVECYGGKPVEISRLRYFYPGGPNEGFETAVDAYRNLWELLNGPESWNASPWVWVLSFDRIP